MPLVEQEYIQNLQEQIYYLELEAAYMYIVFDTFVFSSWSFDCEMWIMKFYYFIRRQQNSKAGDIEPLMLKESQRMTTKIQVHKH